MRSILILRRIKVANANAIGGLTYGFPPISNFLGFTHALSLFIDNKLGLSLGGCAVVCHSHHVNAYQPSGWGDYVFSLTRNPLTKESETPAFIEEGRMHMELSLLIECDFDSEDFDFGSDSNDARKFEDFVHEKALTQRMAGGTIESIESVHFAELPEDSDKLAKFYRIQLLKLLPGFALVDRSDLLRTHHHNLLADNPKAEILDSWLDFIAFKHHGLRESSGGSEANEASKVLWERIAKPAAGWLVPIATGFKGISALFEPGRVARSRDANLPFRFVESVYSIGQWLSPHRVKRLENLFWHYHADGDWYLCQNNFQPEVLETDGQSAFEGK